MENSKHKYSILQKIKMISAVKSAFKWPSGKGRLWLNPVWAHRRRRGSAKGSQIGAAGRVEPNWSTFFLTKKNWINLAQMIKPAQSEFVRGNETFSWLNSIWIYEWTNWIEPAQSRLWNKNSDSTHFFFFFHFHWAGWIRKLKKDSGWASSIRICRNCFGDAARTIQIVENWTSSIWQYGKKMRTEPAQSAFAHETFWIGRLLADDI